MALDIKVSHARCFTLYKNGELKDAGAVIVPFGLKESQSMHVWGNTMV